MHDHAGHSHGAGAPRSRLVVVFCLTLAIFAAEVIGAVLTGSLALLTDAGHMLVDVLGLAVAMATAFAVTRAATETRTWGLKRLEVLAAALQALLLFGIGMFALVEGIQRLFSPPEVPGPGLLFFGVLGLAGNIVGLLLLHAHRGASLNMRAAFLEVVADALGSVAVILAALAVILAGWTRADAVAGILIAALIVPRALVILKDTIVILLESTPRGLDLVAVREHIGNQPHVLAVHDLHASMIDSKLPVLTAHVVLEEECFYDGHAPDILRDLQTCVAEHFAVSVEHSTFQFDRAADVAHDSDVAH